METIRALRKSTPIGAVALVALFVGACEEGTAEVGDPVSDQIPNVLLIVVDTLRADALGVYGADTPTPVIDGLAARGVRFSRARTHIPITGPSHSSLFTSKLPTEHGVLNNGQQFRDRFPTLAESLRADGRTTAAVVSLGVLKGRFGYDRGFDHYGDRFPRDWMKSAAEVTDEALAVADEVLGNPYFFWVHYSDPHEPYAPADRDYPEIELRLDGRAIDRFAADGRGNRFELRLPPGSSRLELVPAGGPIGRRVLFPKLRIRNPEITIEPVGNWRLTERAEGPTTYGARLPATLEIDNPTGETVDTDVKVFARLLHGNREVRSLYADEVSYVDREIGRLLEGLSARGLLDNTLFVFTSDHGEGLGDHGLMGHISQLYDTLLEVPLMLTWPGRLPAGRVVDEPVALVDVFPTIVELVGAPGPADPSGRSLVAAMRGAALRPNPLLAETHRPQAPRDLRAIALGGFKYIRSSTEDGGVEELYDLNRDPAELTDLAASRLGKLGELRVALDRAVAEMVAVDAVEAELSEDEEAQLRALGYVR